MAVDFKKFSRNSDQIRISDPNSNVQTCIGKFDILSRFTYSLRKAFEKIIILLLELNAKNIFRKNKHKNKSLKKSNQHGNIHLIHCFILCWPILNRVRNEVRIKLKSMND